MNLVFLLCLFAIPFVLCCLQSHFVLLLAIPFGGYLQYHFVFYNFLHCVHSAWNCTINVVSSQPLVRQQPQRTHTYPFVWENDESSPVSRYPRFSGGAPFPPRVGVWWSAPPLDRPAVLVQKRGWKKTGTNSWLG